MYETNPPSAALPLHDGPAAGPTPGMVSGLRDGAVGGGDPVSEMPPALQIVSLPVLQSSYRLIGADISARLGEIEHLPKTRENMPRIKALRAALNKEFEAQEAQRIRVKKDLLAPYEAAEALYKTHIAAPYRQADAYLKAWVDEVSGEAVTRCRERLTAYFEELCTALAIDFVTFDQMGVKIDLSTASQKLPVKAMNQIRDRLQRISDDLSAIFTLPDAELVTAEYRRTLSISAAVQAVNERKAAAAAAAKTLSNHASATRAAEESTRRVLEAAPTVTPPQEKRFTVTFSVTATTPMLRGLRAFLEGNHYTYQEE